MKTETTEQYIEQLTADRQVAVRELRKTILQNLPDGFSETISYGMIGFVVPHSIYPSGYHCDPKQPLPFISIASQKNFIALYHMGLYANPDLLKWFSDEYPKHSKTKLDMGKSCIRFKKPDQIPFELIGDLCSKMTTKQWIEIYETNLKR
ncbi:MAG: DUF1801 domain-containing protein [Candidatus Kapabacteria bacterium]|nr:DUF1801 domain-containing protein [Ignavibacteriota bacterium]MCW5884065.1 DUF1801 domain-containing protein [Candidatus Kapabacteria bacterium]MCW5919432.1 DUF1801 domain-containing protein [Bacteroidota bacterium]